MAKSSRTSLIITAIVCVTLVLILAIGAGLHMHQQDIAQQDRALQQEKQLKEYEQAEINKRSADDNKIEKEKCSASQSYNWFSDSCR